MFYQGDEGRLEIETDFRIKQLQFPDGGRAEQRSSRRAPLELSVTQGEYVDLAFNAQGMPLRRAKKQKYVRGETLYFHLPVTGCVAGFAAYSGGAGLGCGWDPTDSGSCLGVLASAEGTSMREKTLRRFTEFDIEVCGAMDEQYIGASSLAALLGELEQGGKLAPEMRELILRRAMKND